MLTSDLDPEGTDFDELRQIGRTKTNRLEVSNTYKER